jgi:hypothetical protein
LIETNVGAIAAADFLARPHDYRILHGALLIAPSGEASLTVTLIRSPRLAIAPVDPPMPIIISTRRAPELSATSSEVCICIIVDFQLPIAHLPLASAQPVFSTYPFACREIGNRKSAIGNAYFAAFCTISTTRQRFLVESGRVSTMRTRSPVVAPSSSCAMNFEVRRT